MASTRGLEPLTCGSNPHGRIVLRFVDSSSSLGGGNRTHVIQHILNLFRRQGEYTKMPECNNPSCSKPAAVKYCSRNCAAVVNNAVRPKRLRTSKQWNDCSVCGKQVRGKVHVDCKIAISLGRSLEEYTTRASVSDKPPSWKYSHVRVVARSVNKDLRQLPCQVCGYSKHIELAHITPVSSFDPSTPIGVVNHRDNILVLCRNHHWEFDHGILSLDQITKRMDPTPGVEPGSSA